MSKVFLDDFLSADISVAWLEGTISTISIAVIIKIYLVAVSALPEDIMRSECHEISKLVIHLLEIFQEGESSVG